MSPKPADALDTLRHLRLLHDSLLLRGGGTPAGRYTVPALWLPPGRTTRPVDVNPYEFYAGVTGSIIGTGPVPLVGKSGAGGPLETGDRSRGAGQGGRWSAEAVVYNMMVRLTCAYDHVGDGELSLQNGCGWREGGSFLKAIAILSHISSLGANTIHLLPVQEIGHDGRRGNLGSPYAVKDPMAFDPALGEPNTGLDIGSQFAAFLEAAHHRGIRVILELPLRTLSKDCVWVRDHPEWFYWITQVAAFRPPTFTDGDIRRATEKIESGNHENLPAPAQSYREMFTESPDPGSITIEGDRWTGTTADGRKVVIPGAFADWPPDDHQPVWDDVTYLKYHQDERFNYPAYNTIRMYDSSLLAGGTGTIPLWEKIENVVAHYATVYGIDGLMIDMAHAMPGEMAVNLIRNVREIHPDFAFWAEDFSRNEDQVRLGFNAALGGQWACQHRTGDFVDMLDWLARTPGLPPHLATPETHNTPRAIIRPGGERFCRYAWTISCFIPGIPFIHSGFELYEQRPVNTGLGFTADQLSLFPPESLPLFSAHRLRWDAVTAPPDWMSRPLAVRERFRDRILAGHDAGFRLISGGDPRIIAFVRTGSGGDLIVAANADMETRVNAALAAEFKSPEYPDLLSESVFQVVHGVLSGILEPGQVVVFDLPTGERV